MVFIPTWIDMLVLLVTFGLTSVQLRLENSDRSPVLTVPFGLLVCFLILMLLTIFLNRSGSLTSIGLFIAALVSLGTAVVMWRRMPPPERHS